MNQTALQDINESIKSLNCNKPRLTHKQRYSLKEELVSILFDIENEGKSDIFCGQEVHNFRATDMYAYLVKRKKQITDTLKAGYFTY